MIRARLPTPDRLARTLERRALRRLEVHARTARNGGHSWRSPTRLWPDFGDD